MVDSDTQDLLNFMKEKMNSRSHVLASLLKRVRDKTARTYHPLAHIHISLDSSENLIIKLGEKQLSISLPLGCSNK